MNKIIDKKSNVLRICAGNDFSILVQVTEYNTETGAWVNYDLSAVSDVHMCLIADNGKRINLPVTVNSNGTASAPIQAAYLQKTTYGVELTWLNENLNRRTYAPCLLQIVTSTAESTSNIAEYDSNDAYHFNIKMEADVAILSIGKISDEYITESELEKELENYTTNSSLETTLENYTTNASLETTLENYTTNASLETTLENYTTNASLESKLKDYATVSSLENYVTNSSLETTLNNFATKQYVDNELANIDLSEYYTKSQIDNTLSDYVTNTSLNSTLNDYATVSSLNDYVTNTSLNSTLSEYVTDSELNTSLNPITSDITSLDDRVTTLENNPSVPNNVVTSDDANEIVCLTQEEYDALEQSDTLDPKVFYYITDATSNYVTNSSLTTTLTNYATKNYVDTAVSQVQPDTSNLVTISSSQTISGQKTFTGESKFGMSNINNNSTWMNTDLIYGVYKSSSFVRPTALQMVTGEIVAPTESATSSSTSDGNLFNTEANVIKFRKIDSTSGNGLITSISELARIDSNGIYEGDTLLSDKYALKSEIPTSGVSEQDWDNSNEAIAKEFVNNRLEHLSINHKFNDYYTKTVADIRYATLGWTSNNFVTKKDNENQNQAIAEALSSSVQSNTIHNIVQISQTDYDALTDKDTNTLYIIL